MKITKIRATVGLEFLAAKLQAAISDAGYISETRVVNSSRIDIGMHMKSFIVDTKVHGYNTRFNPHMNPKRTSTPSWDQRVDYNNIINDVLNAYQVSANIKSGPFDIRQGLRTFDESDWVDQKPDYLTHNECRGYYIEEGFDEIEFKARQKRQAQERRAKAKQREDVRPHLRLA